MFIAYDLTLPAFNPTAFKEEWRICGMKSTLGQADIIANSYGMPIISDVHLDLQTYIKQMVKRKNKMELWKDCYSSSIVKERLTLNVEDNHSIYRTKKGPSNCVNRLCHANVWRGTTS